MYNSISIVKAGIDSNVVSNVVSKTHSRCLSK